MTDIPETTWGLARVALSLSAGMWLTDYFHKPFLPWSGIYGLSVLLGIHVIWMASIVIKCWFEWRRQ